MPFGMAKLVGGICFSLGLILCVVCGADLFTSTVLIVVAKASGRITWGQLAKNWLNVYFGNPGRRTAVCTFNVAFRRVYDRKWSMGTKRPTNRRPQSAPYFYWGRLSWYLANLMVCLAVWMSYSGRSLMDKAFIMVLPVAMFVASGFEHSIANMFMIPMGIVIRDFASRNFGPQSVLHRKIFLTWPWWISSLITWFRLRSATLSVVVCWLGWHTGSFTCVKTTTINGCRSTQ